MSKIILEIPFLNQMYEIRSEPLTRSLFHWLSKQQIKDTDDNIEMFDSLVKQAGAEWKVGDSDWREDGWDQLPPNVSTAWLEKMMAISGEKVEAQIKSEKN